MCTMQEIIDLLLQQQDHAHQEPAMRPFVHPIMACTVMVPGTGPHKVSYEETGQCSDWAVA